MRKGEWIRTYRYSSVQKQSTEKNIRLWEREVDTYYELIDNALNRINLRRDILKKEVDGIMAFDTYLTGWSFGQIFFDMLRIFFRHKSHCNTIDAYNHLTSMKNRLDKLAQERFDKCKRKEVALIFKKQNIYLNKELPNENIPKEILQKNIIPFLLENPLPNVSKRDIALLGYWSDGVGTLWLQSYPPQGTIYIGSKALGLHGAMSKVLCKLR